VTVEGSEGTTPLEHIELGFGGTTRMEDIESFRIAAGQADLAARPGATLAEGTEFSKKISLMLNHELAAGDHWIWVSPVLKNTASVDGRIDASVFGVKAGGKILTPSQPSPEGARRIGYAVRLPGYDGVGDPSILVDPSNGRIWIAARRAAGSAWNGSGSGITPEETG
jgi:hypothetical protein